MTLRGAVDFLATLVITGVVNNYDLDQLPNALAKGQLPALVPHLLDTRGGQGTQAGQILVYDGSKYMATYYVEHYCYWMPEQSGALKDFMDDAYAFVDSYMAKMALNFKLNGQIDEPLAIMTVDIGLYAYPEPDADDTRFWAVRLLHRWRVQVSAA